MDIDSHLAIKLEKITRSRLSPLWHIAVLRRNPLPNIRQYLGKNYPELVFFGAYKPGLIVPPARARLSKGLKRTTAHLSKSRRKRRRKRSYIYNYFITRGQFWLLQIMNHTLRYSFKKFYKLKSPEHIRSHRTAVIVQRSLWTCANNLAMQTQ